MLDFVMFAIVFITVVGIFAIYLTRQLLAPYRSHWAVKLVTVSIVASAVLATPFIVIMRRAGFENKGMDILAWAGYLSLGFFSFALTLMIFRDTGWIFLSVFNKFKALFLYLTRLKKDKPEAGFDKHRRRFILQGINLGIVSGAGLLTGCGVVEARQTPNVKKVLIPIKNMPKDLANLRIVQITDIHVSPTIKRAFVQNVVSVVNGLKPDIVVLTGDLVDGSVDYLSSDVDPIQDIKAGVGRFFVTGNHEYYSGVLPWITKVKSLGFDVLLNENKIVRYGNANLMMAGVTDYYGGRFYKSHRSDPHKAVKTDHLTDLKILLAHQPRSIFDAAAAGFDVQISGHTHGGQFFPWNFMVYWAQPFVVGLHTYQNTQIYVSAGTGYWGPPLRLGSPSEITLIQFKESYGSS